MPNLGERIYKLRSKNNMSQGEFAEKLDVSRQAVSKWENNVSVPELDKIAAISELFGVSTDMLIKGEQAAESKEKEPQVPPIIIEHTESGFSKHKIAQILGIIFIVLGIPLATLMALLAADWIFIAMFILLAVNGVVLLACKKHTWLALLIVNAVLIILFLLVFETSMRTLQYNDVVELTESISAEADRFDTSEMIIE